MHLDPWNLATIVISLIEITNLSSGHVIKTSPSKPMTGTVKVHSLLASLHSLNLVWGK